MIVIRQALESDAQTLTDLGAATFIQTFAKDNRSEDIQLYIAKTFGLDKQLSEIRDPIRRIEIAWSGDQAVGFLHLKKGRPDPSVKGAKPIEVLRLYVDSRWRGQGVGAALMDKAVLVTRQEGFQTLWLGVWEQSPRGQAFYKKCGFRVVGQHIFRLGMDDQIDLIMVRSI